MTKVRVTENVTNRANSKRAGDCFSIQSSCFQTAPTYPVSIRPPDYETAARPLSYVGTGFEYDHSHRWISATVLFFEQPYFRCPPQGISEPEGQNHTEMFYRDYR